MDLDPSLVLGLGSFGRILLACWLGGTISSLEFFLLNLLRDPFYVFYITHFVEFYGHEPSTCFGFFNSLGGIFYCSILLVQLA
jgi:hypothetical protein